jgi:hypothetical protein
MATLGQYAKAQTATGAAADTSLQALMLLMQHMAQREDRKSDRESHDMQMEMWRGQLAQQRIAAERELPGNALVQNIQQARGLKGYGDIVARADELKKVLDMPKGADPTLFLAEEPYAQALVHGGGFDYSTGGLDKDTWSREWSSANRRVDRYIKELSRYPDLDPSVIENIEAELRTTVGESLGLYDPQYSQLSAEALGQSLVVAELNNGLNHKEIDLSYLKGRHPEHRDAIEKIGKSSRGWSDVKGAGLQQRVGGSVEEIIKRTPDHGLHPETITMLEDLPAKDRHELLNRINAEGAPAVFEEIKEAQPPPEPGFWDKAGGVAEDWGVPAAAAAIAARGAAAAGAPGILSTLGSLGYFAGTYGKELITKGAIPALVADLGAKGGAKVAEGTLKSAKAIGVIDEQELKQSQEALGQHISEAKRGLLGLWSGAKATRAIAGGALSRETVSLPLEMLDRIAHAGDPLVKEERKAEILKEIEDLEREPNQTPAVKKEIKDAKERLEYDLYDSYMKDALAVQKKNHDELREMNPAGPGAAALRHDSNKHDSDIQYVMNQRRLREAPEPFGPEEQPGGWYDPMQGPEEDPRLGPPGPPGPPEPWDLEDPPRPELMLPPPEPEPEQREYDPLMQFLGVSQAPPFTMDSPAPYPSEIQPPVSDPAQLGPYGQYAGGYPEALQLIQEMALQQAPTQEMMMQGSPPIPPAGDRHPGGSTMTPQSPQLPPEQMLELIMMQAQMAQAGQSPLSVGSQPDPRYSEMAPPQNAPQGPPQGLPPELMLELLMMQAQMAQAGQSPLSVGSPPVPQGY